MYNEKYVIEAFNLANKAFKEGEIPVGAVIVLDNKIIGRGYNRTKKFQNNLKHAEIMAIEDAYKNTKTNRLDGAEIYITLEPCTMCYGAILLNRISKLYFCAKDSNFGFFSNYGFINDKKLMNTNIEFYYLKEYEIKSQEILNLFFSKKR